MREEYTRTCVHCSTPFTPRKPSSPQMFCSRTCWVESENQRSSSIDHIAKRFWSKVDKSNGPDGCWPFTGTKHLWGYGKFGWSAGNMMDSHRASYTLTYGDIPEGMVIRHTCDNPPCCNPEHLTIGTPRDNTMDSINRGRFAIGERNGMAKLTEDQVREMRDLYIPGDLTYGQNALARRFQVSQATARRALLGKTWKGVV